MKLLRSLAALLCLLPAVAWAESGAKPPPGLAKNSDAALKSLSSPAVTGRPTGTTDLPSTAVRLPFYGWDGSLQARVETLHGATGYLGLQGGGPGLGPTLKCDSDTDAVVPCNFFARGAADMWFINNYGPLLHLYSPSAMITNYPALTGSLSGQEVLFESQGGDTNISVGLAPKGTGGIVNRRHDGSVAGGNSIGSYAIDLQPNGIQSAATQVASGIYSILIGGGGSTASASRAVGFACQGCMLDGVASSGFSAQNISAFGRYAWNGYGNQFFRSTGDAQGGRQMLVGKSTASSGVRLTADQNAASAGTRNCFNLTTAGTILLRLELAAHDYTTSGHHAGYTNTLMLARDAAASTTTISLGAAQTFGDAIGVSVAADTTLGCINVTVTPPSANATDEWHYNAKLDGPEVH